MEKFGEWWARLPKDFKEWVYGQGLNIRNHQHPTKLAHRCWNHQQAKIDKLEQEKRELVEALEKSVEYLKQGKAKFAPHTTNSFVDKFIEKWEAKIKSEKG